MQPQTAVVIGGTGFIGEHLLNELLNDAQFTHVRALVRRPAAAPHPKLEAVLVDFDNPDDLKEKIGTGDCLFCCVGTTQQKVKGNKVAYRRIDFDIPLHAAEVACSAGFHSFLLVSAVGANSRSGNFYLKLKGEVEYAVEATGMPCIHVFRPSMLMGGRNEFRLLEQVGKLLMYGLNCLLAGPLRQYKGINGRKVAKAMVEASKQEIEGVHIYAYDEMMKLAQGTPG